MISPSFPASEPRLTQSRPPTLLTIFSFHLFFHSSSHLSINLSFHPPKPPFQYNIQNIIMATKHVKVSVYQERVYALLLQIPLGKISSYASLSKALGSSPRAVGGALRNNPFAPEVPCHRVISASGVSPQFPTTRSLLFLKWATLGFGVVLCVRGWGCGGYGPDFWVIELEADFWYLVYWWIPRRLAKSA